MLNSSTYNRFVQLFGALEDIGMSIQKLELWYLYKCENLQTEELRLEREKKFLTKQAVRNLVFRVGSVARDVYQVFDSEQSERAKSLKSKLSALGILME